MAITEDTTNQPALPTTWTNAWTSAKTTGSFSPQANTLIVALVSADGGATGVTASVTDSLGGTWTLLKRTNTASTAFGTAEVWCRYVSSAPGSMTVSVVKATGTSANGGQLAVKLLLGAASTQTGATGSVVRDSAGTIQASVAAGTGNMIYGSAYNWSNSTAMTVLGNTTVVTAFVDSTNGDNWAAFKSSSSTAGTATYGYSTSVQGSLAAVEILAVSGTNYTQTVTDDAGSTDTASQVAAAAQAVTDAAGSTDTPQRLASAVQAFTDNAGSTDSVARVAAYLSVVIDPAGSTDSASTTVTAFRTITDDAGAADSTSQSSGGALHTGFADGDSTGLTYDADTGAYTLWTAFYANGRAGVSAAGVRVYVASGLDAGGVGFTGRLAVKSGGGSGPPDTTLETKTFGIVATDAWTQVLFDTTHLMPDAVGPTFTFFWVGVDFPAGHYSYKANVFGSPIQFHDLTGVWLASSAETTPGNASFGAGLGGQFPTNAASSNGWYGVDPVVSTSGGTDYTQTVTDGAGASDAVTQLSVGAQQFTDQAGVTDTTAQTATSLRSQTDNAGSTDTQQQASQNSYAQTFTDSAGSTDAAAQLAAAARSQTDLTGSTDTAIPSRTLPVSLTDDAGSTDLGQTYEADYAETLTDPAGSTDVMSQQTSSSDGQTFTDNVGATDSVGQQSVSHYAYTFTDDAGLTDLLAKELDRIVTDLAGSTDITGQVTNQTRTVADDAGSTDAVNQQTSSSGAQTFTDTAGGSDTTSQAVGSARAQSDNAGSTDSVSQQQSSAGSQTFTDSAGSTDSVTQTVTYAAVVTDSAGSTDLVIQSGTNLYTVTLTDNTGATDVMTQAGHPFPDLALVATVESDRLTVSVESGRLANAVEQGAL